jgi:hypothetical protein
MRASIPNVRTVGALCGAILLSLAAAPVAEAAGGPTEYAPKGTLDYVWTGDPARGCAAAGVCGVTGSLQVEMDGSGIYGVSPGSLIDLSDPNSVARVAYPSNDGGNTRTCVEPEPYDMTFALRPRSGPKTEAVPEFELDGGLPSAGDCAGPTAAQMIGLRLPARAIGVRGYDLSGDESFGAGPFEVNVSSTMQALFAPEEAADVESARRAPEPRRELEAYADVDYRMTGLHGHFSIPFAGTQPPGCEPVSSCGASGALTMALRGRDQALSFSGSQIVKHRIGSTAALAGLRSGSVPGSDGYGPLTLTGSVTGTFIAPGVDSCTNTVMGVPDELSSIFAARRDVLSFYAGPGAEPPLGLEDPLRTECPGPSSPEMLGNGALATGAIPLAELGARRLQVVLRSGGAFTSATYTGSRSGSITFTLIRTAEHGGTRSIRAIPGESPG